MSWCRWWRKPPSAPPARSSWQHCFLPLLLRGRILLSFSSATDGLPSRRRSSKTQHRCCDPRGERVLVPAHAPRRAAPLEILARPATPASARAVTLARAERSLCVLGRGALLDPVVEVGASRGGDTPRRARSRWSPLRACCAGIPRTRPRRWSRDRSHRPKHARAVAPGSAPRQGGASESRVG
jgi:hypothetical protein